MPGVLIGDVAQGRDIESVTFNGLGFLLAVLNLYFGVRRHESPRPPRPAPRPTWHPSVGALV